VTEEFAPGLGLVDRKGSTVLSTVVRALMRQAAETKLITRMSLTRDPSSLDRSVSSSAC